MRQFLIPLAAAAALSTPFPSSLSADEPVIADAVTRELSGVIEKVHSAVVPIEILMGNLNLTEKTDEDAPRRRPQSSAGSGVIISPDGYIVTNFHVAGQAKAMEIGVPGRGKYLARLVGTDPAGDVALLKIDSKEKLPFAEIGDSSALRVGQWAVAIGNPWNTALNDYSPSATLGIVSGLHRYNAQGGFVYGDSIQIDAAINPGNSGGPLFDLDGKLVGINGKINIRRGRVNCGIGYAIPINQIMGYLDELKAGKKLEHGQLGINGQTDRDLKGVLITEIPAGSAAEKAGLENGDLLLSVNGRRVHEMIDVRNIVSPFLAGRTVQLEILRDTGKKTVEVALQKPPKPPARGAQPGAPKMPPGAPKLPAPPKQAPSEEDEKEEKETK